LIGLYGGLLLGLFFNVVVMAALLYRWLFFPLRPEQLHANNWINLGGFAIVAVAGMKLAALHARSVAPGGAVWTGIPIRPLVIFSWAVATWWLPILVAIGIWRHALQRLPLRYETPYWALVFSPSVYALATAGLIVEYRFDALLWFPPLFVVFAVVAWVVLMTGFTRSLFRS
jgi:tellurite resistance protein TehA-like permease